MLWLIFLGVVLLLIWAGVLISRVDSLSQQERGGHQWIWGIVIILLLLMIPLVLLGMVVAYMQYPQIAETVNRWKP